MIEYLREIETENTLACLPGAQMGTVLVNTGIACFCDATSERVWGGGTGCCVPVPYYCMVFRRDRLTKTIVFFKSVELL